MPSSEDGNQHFPAPPSREIAGAITSEHEQGKDRKNLVVRRQHLVFMDLSESGRSSGSEGRLETVSDGDDVSVHRADAAGHVEPHLHAPRDRHERRVPMDLERV
jgi:hypothetical protein